MKTVTKLTPFEQMEKARRKYEQRVKKAQYHNDILDAAVEYMGQLERLVTRSGTARPLT